MTDNCERKIDIVVFGASGFTGKYVVEEILKLSQKKKNFTWGIAGRNKDKLITVLKEVGRKMNEEIESIPVLICDVENYNSVLKMTSQAKVIANCVGPYRFFGEAVVKACIETRTHQVDITAEAHYMLKMALIYDKMAKDRQVIIVNACGFSCIPAEMGTIYLENKFNGVVNSIEMYFESINECTDGGALAHYGTWESGVYCYGNSKELQSLHQKLYLNNLPAFLPKLKRRFYLHTNELVKGLCTPYPAYDESMVYRSQRYFYEKNKKRPVQVAIYGVIGSYLIGFVQIILAGIFLLLCQLNTGRKLLLTYPRLFTFGFVSHEGPSEEAADKHESHVTLIGKGWNEKLAEPTDNHTTPPNKKLVVKIKMQNPGYRSTATAMVLSAITILKEKDKISVRGGILTPSVAFHETSLLEELQNNGFIFEC